MGRTVYLPRLGCFFMINVGKYTVRPMDPMGILYFLVENLHRAIWSLRRGLKAWPCAGELCTCEAVWHGRFKVIRSVYPLVISYHGRGLVLEGGPLRSL